MAGHLTIADVFDLPACACGRPATQYGAFSSQLCKRCRNVESVSVNTTIKELRQYVQRREWHLVAAALADLRDELGCLEYEAGITA